LLRCSDWASDKHRTVDDRPFGGGPGMVMKVGPLAGAVESLKTTLPDAPVVYLSPQGALFDQSMAQRWKQLGSVILIAGRYEGIDERIIDTLVDEEVSLGDFVLRITLGLKSLMTERCRMFCSRVITKP